MDHVIAKRKPIVLALAVIALSAASSAAFAGWATYGVDIFMTMAASGLAWCL